MKKLCTLTFLLISFLTNAQTETVAPKAKKLQQLYLSVGVGPAFTLNSEARTRGISLMTNTTWVLSSERVYRLGFNISGFANKNAPKPDLILDNVGTDFNIISPNFSIGKRKAISKNLQLMGLAGGSVNLLSRSGYISPEQAAAGAEASCIPELYVRPGILMQAEALTTPSKFCGFSFALYYHLMPKISSFGVNLSLNLGKMGGKESKIL